MGCGGVGSHTAASLARSGVSKIRLIDFDQVTLSSLNRHAVATLADVGTPKVHCIRKRLEQVTPWVHFDCRNELFSENDAGHQLNAWDPHQSPTYVVDAIDNIDSKVALLRYCYEHNLPVVSSMGAGCKSDPTRILIGDISASTDDPLSKSTRRRLRAAGISSGIPVVFSTEKPGPGKAELLPLPDDEFSKGSVGELGVLPDFRVRILPVIGTMPAIFGLAVANHAILEITGYPHSYLPGKLREKLYDGVHGTLQGAEERLAKHNGGAVVGLRLPLTVDDVGYLVEEVYSARSVISGVPTRLALIRWAPPQKLNGERSTVDETVEGQKVARLRLGDLVCMTKEEATKHEREVLKGGRDATEVWGEEAVKRVQRKLEEEQAFERFR